VIGNIFEKGGPIFQSCHLPAIVIAILYQLSNKTPFSLQKDGVCFYHTPKLTAYDCL